jgi:hypothetical protein
MSATPSPLTSAVSAASTLSIVIGSPAAHAKSVDVGKQVTLSGGGITGT